MELETIDEILEKDMNRAKRRHHWRRLLNKRRSDENFRWGDKSKSGMVVNTPCSCSCPGCGNPRRHFGEKTVQERRFDGGGHEVPAGQELLFDSV